MLEMELCILKYFLYIFFLYYVGVMSDDERLRCDLTGSLQCLMSFSSTNQFTVSSYSNDPHVNPAALVQDMCM